MKNFDYAIEKMLWFVEKVQIYCKLSQAYNYYNIKGTIMKSKKKINDIDCLIIELLK